VQALGSHTGNARLGVYGAWDSGAENYSPRTSGHADVSEAADVISLNIL
jgi:hypothetical protein